MIKVGVRKHVFSLSLSLTHSYLKGQGSLRIFEGRRIRSFDFSGVDLSIEAIW